ncbi:MAG: type II toxin-antitoxin system prevent-host-death family antitoxin [Anaerolineales bacterium]|nr:type II toxin-antitoxin system prevent-host-death family antitoxin [Anaerolineales bacterium]
MNTQTISLTELKQHLGDYVKRAAFGGERIILVSHGQESAALISIADLRLLEQQGKQNETLAYVQQQETLLKEARLLREQMAAGGFQVSTTDLLDEVREERTDDLLDLR